MPTIDNLELAVNVLDALPNAVFVKDHETRYVWVNHAFEWLMGVTLADVHGQLDADLFKDRQAAQCNGGDLRVLASGKVDEAEETMYHPELGAREVVTRKSRLTVDGQPFLVGIMHDLTEVVETNRQLVELSRELDRLATQDSLTGCLNRRALDKASTGLGEAPGPVGLIVMDLDDFKAVNDDHGHSVGDAVLIHFADTVRANVRPGDLVARLGGEEFTVLLPDATLEETHRIADRICEAVAATPTTIGDAAIQCTVSIGAVHDEHPQPLELDQMITAADLLMYRAKEQGRNQVVKS